jgi:2'-5' RNA ligase
MEIWRTFIGVPLKVDGAFLQAREDLVRSLGKERISWVDPSLFHITVRFIGDTDPSGVKLIAQALRQHVPLPGKTELYLDRTGSFGPAKKPRVVWVGFREPAIFNGLAAGVDKALDSCGFPVRDQVFRAHLTLGRIRSLSDPQGFHKIMEEMGNSFSGPVLLDRIVFYRSRLAEKGPVYTPLEVLEFKD